MPALVTIQYTADELKCHPRTVRRYISAGLLTAVRIGPRMLRIDADSLHALARPV